MTCNHCLFELNVSTIKICSVVINFFNHCVLINCQFFCHCVQKLKWMKLCHILKLNCIFNFKWQINILHQLCLIAKFVQCLNFILQTMFVRIQIRRSNFKITINLLIFNKLLEIFNSLQICIKIIFCHIKTIVCNHIFVHCVVLCSDYCSCVCSHSTANGMCLHKHNISANFLQIVGSQNTCHTTSNNQHITL